MSNRFSSSIALFFIAASFPVCVFADQSGTANLDPETYLNLDTGAVSRSGGDIFFDGSNLSPQGSAALYNLGKYGSRVFKSIRASQASSVSYVASPIPASALVPGDIFGIRTNSGHYVKVIVSATNYGTLSLQYTIFGAAAVAHTTAAAPVISGLANNYSFIRPGVGLPNYGIAPGSIFVIFGTGLSINTPPVLQSSASPGLQTTLNQTSVSVTVNGTTVSPFLYYTSATQVAAVLPSTTPVGNGTITVTYAGQPSAPAPIQVVANAPGLLTMDQSGNGLVKATNNLGNVYGVTSSAQPGATVIFWGTGIGADTANNDQVYPQKQDNLAGSLGLQFLIGGISATVQYAGRSQYPGLDQYNVVIPANVTPGCFVSAVVQIGSIVSNAVTMPISANGGACSDAVTGLSGTEIQSLASKASGTVNALGAFLSVHPGGTGSVAFALASSAPSAWFAKGYEYASEGSCTIVPPEQGAFSLPGALDLGTLQLGEPTITVASQGGGLYQVGGLTIAPGTYTFSASGGANVGAFSVNVTVPALNFSWTNPGALTNITRSQGATVTWTGGPANGNVQVTASVGAPAVKLFCYAPASAGQLTIPPSMLLGLPAGPGDLAVGPLTAPQTITASGVDLGLAGVFLPDNGPANGNTGVTFK
jgi:uncharacterized protein (TIGR03437 family)